ncbi:MAG TPA: hypothetical protein VFV48_00520 [Pseudomonadales bacterium]|nr:hypothetical protein [Pseudomonadales bacterium]
MTIRENGEWLRFLFWCCAIGLALLAIQNTTSANRDFTKIIASILGVLLFGFSALTFKTHKVVIDCGRKTITLIKKGFRNTTQQTILFSAVEHIVVVKTFHYNEDLLPANRWQERWYLALMCKDEIVTLTHNPSVQKEEARRLALDIQSILHVDILDSDHESLNVLLKSGRRAEAITLAARSLGMSVTEASKHVASLK